jgi:Siphovirus Gp157
VIRSALDDEELAASLRSRMHDMKERLERIEATAAKKRDVALAAMEEADIERILEPDFTVSLRAAPPGVVITSEQAIPEWFWIPQTPKLDRRKLLEVLKTGEAVTGVELADTRIILAVRTK